MLKYEGDVMEMETTIAAGIRAAGDRAKYDEACKWLLSEKGRCRSCAI